MPEEEIAKSYLYIADKNGAPYSPSWITFNSKITYELRHQIKLFFGCNNITNLRYRPYSSGLAAPGRNFVISVSSRF